MSRIKEEFLEQELTSVEPELLFTRPELLLHPNIPKPLHGLAPRTLVKQSEWTQIRREAYAKNNYHCWACGTYRHYDLALLKFVDDNGTLDAHESYDIDYENKTVELKEIVALCKHCHNYIHSGRLGSMYDKGQCDEQDCWEIINHGDSVLIDGGLVPYNAVDKNTYQDEWDEWRLIFNGKEHRSRWKDYWDWMKHYMIGG
jgi:hypothetical protein